jgi:general stress protein 26
MRQIEGLKKAFESSPLVYLTTFGDDEKHSRPMTNFNEDPYERMWFATYKDTQKLKDIKNNPRVVITVPAEEENTFYEIEGEAHLADDKTVAEKWRWWYLFWHPEKGGRHGPSGYGSLTDHRAIIYVEPKEVSISKP